MTSGADILTQAPDVPGPYTPVRRIPLGRMFLDRRLIEQEDLDRALDLQRERGDKLGKILVDMGSLANRDMLAVLSEQLQIPLVVLEGPPPVAPEIDGLSPRFLRQAKVIPAALHDAVLTIAMADPLDLETLAAVRGYCGLKVVPALAGEQEILDAIDRYYGDAGKPQSDFAGAAEDGENLEHLRDMASEAPVIRLVNAMIASAVERRASDIHIEPFEKEFRIRFRVDGVLFNQDMPPREMKAAIVSRLKLMGKLNIAERRLPQDGRIKIKLGGGKDMDFRVSVLPTLFGEKICMRLLDKSNLQTDLTKLGYEQEALAHFLHEIHKPFGMVLVTGPTGSGKTVSLYSALSELNKVSENISTAEDPVEFNFAGINQVQMHEDIGLNFAAALRSFLRQDPDIIMIGEIRDFETAEIATKAALTGHLVLSTLHTNDAPATINRLLNMGIEPFLVASAVNLITAQRLARRVCVECKEPEDIPVQALIDAGVPPDEAPSFVCMRGKGCPVCNNTGYKGRVGFYQVMPMLEEIRELILNGANTAEIKRESMRLGIKTMRQSGLTKLKEGVTSFEEVVRVTVADD